MPAPSAHRQVGACLEPVGRELTDRRQHRHPRFAARLVDVSNETLLDETGQRVEDVELDVVDRPETGDHGLDRGDLRLGEHGHQREQALLAGPEEAVAPVHRRPQRLLSLREVARPTAQEPQSVSQSIPQDVRGEQAQVRRGEFDRQGQAIEPAADVGHDGGVVVGQREPGPDHERPIDEQLDGLGLADLMRRDLPAGRREAERSDRVDLLRPNAKRLATGGQDRQPRARAQQPGDEIGRFGHLLEVVEHEEHLPIAEVVDELVLERTIDVLAEPDRPRDRDEDGVRVAGLGQVHEGDAIQEGWRQVLGDLDRQRRLAGAARSRQGQQSDRSIREPIPDLGEFASATDQPGGPGRQVRPGRARRDQRREVRRQVWVDELEEALRPTEVLQAMLAQVDQVGARRAAPRVLARSGRLGQEDLAAVPGGHDPGRPVDRRPEVVVATMLGLAGVHPHPHPQRTGLAPRLRGHAELGGQGGRRRVRPRARTPPSSRRRSS